MNKTVKKIIIGSGITASALAVAGAVSYIITNKLVKVALDREDPLKMKKSIQLRIADCYRGKTKKQRM